MLRYRVLMLAALTGLWLTTPGDAQIPGGSVPFATDSRAGKVIPDGVTCNVTDNVGTLTCGGGGGSGTVNAGTTPQAAYYDTSSAAVSGASGVTFPNANSISVGSPTGSSPGTGVVDVAIGYQINGVVSGQVVAGTSQTVTAAQWTASTTFVVSTAGQTLTLPASSSLSVNGGIVIQTVGQTVSLTPNGTDTINGVNSSVTIGAGLSSVVTTNGGGAIYATPTTSPFAVSGAVKSNGSGVYTQSACADLSNGATGCSTATGTSGHTLPFLDGNNTHSGVETFGTVVGGGRIVSGTTDTASATDCGGTLHFTSGSAITATLPNNITTLQCTITYIQEGAGQITFAAAGGATIHSRSSFTKTAGQWGVVDIILNTNAGGTSAVYTLAGDGA